MLVHQLIQINQYLKFLCSGSFSYVLFMYSVHCAGSLFIIRFRFSLFMFIFIFMFSFSLFILFMFMLLLMFMFMFRFRFSFLYLLIQSSFHFSIYKYVQVSFYLKICPGFPLLFTNMFRFMSKFSFCLCSGSPCLCLS